MDRWAVCQGYWLYSTFWGGDGCHVGNAIANRLHHLRYEPRGSYEYLESSEPDAKEIYGRLVRKYQGEYIAYERWHRRHPEIFPAWPGYQSLRPNAIGRAAKDYVRSLGIDPACLEIWS